MLKFSELTSFIDKFKNIEYGVWIIDRTNDGGLEHPIEMPYVKYNGLVNEFVKTVYDFNDAHPEYNLTEYKAILNKQKIEWSKHAMASAVVDDLDEQTVLALIVEIIRAYRFYEGTIKSILENGKIQKCLIRLNDIDNK